MKWCDRCGEEFDPPSRTTRICDFCLVKSYILGIVKARKTNKLRKLLANLPTC